MKRASFLTCAGADASRFKVLNYRGQLTFEKPNDEDHQKWSSYTLQQAFELRLTLDLIGGEDAAEVAAVGISPSHAAVVLSNALFAAAHDGVDVTAPGTYAGVAVLEEAQADGSSLRFTRWFCNDLSTFKDWLASTEEHEQAKAVRVILANTARAAGYVRSRAIELDLPEAGDPITCN